MHNHRGGDRQILGPHCGSVNLVESWSLSPKQTNQKEGPWQQRRNNTCGWPLPTCGWPLASLHTYTHMHCTHTHMSTHVLKRNFCQKFPGTVKIRSASRAKSFSSPVLKGKSRHRQQSIRHLLQSIHRKDLAQRPSRAKFVHCCQKAARGPGSQPLERFPKSSLT